MADHENTPDEILPINLEEVTDVFVKLRSAAAKTKTIEDFMALVKTPVEEIVIKHSNPPEGKTYKQEDLDSLTAHIMDCVNRIMPASIPYKSVSVDTKWSFVPIDVENERRVPKSN